MSLAEAIMDPAARARIRRAIAVRTADEPAFAAAWAEACAIESPFAGGEARSDVAIDAAQAGLVAMAQEFAEQIEAPSWRLRALRGIGAATARRDVFDAALTFARAAQSGHFLAVELRDIAIAQGQAGLFADALETRLEIANQPDRAILDTNLVGLLIDQQVFSQAAAIICGSADSFTRVRQLSAIVDAQSRAGAPEEAFYTALGISTPYFRATALRAVAAALAGE